MKLKFNAKGITRAIIKEMAPEAFEGIISEWVKDKSVGDFYKFLDNEPLWNKISPSQQEFLLGYAPWDLEWLNERWFLEAVGKVNTSLAFLIVSSPELSNKLEANLADIKQRLS